MKQKNELQLNTLRQVIGAQLPSETNTQQGIFLALEENNRLLHEISNLLRVQAGEQPVSPREGKAASPQGARGKRWGGLFGKK